MRRRFVTVSSDVCTLKESRRLLEFSAAGGTEMTLPFYGQFLAQPASIRQGVAQHGACHVFGSGYLGLGPHGGVFMPVGGVVGAENSQAVEDDGEVGQKLIVPGVGCNATFSHETQVRQFMSHGGDLRHGFVQM